MKRYLPLLLSFLYCGNQAQAQLPEPKDTSFTVYSAFQKNIKKYPAIKIVQPRLPAQVKQALDVTYCTLGDRYLKADVFFPQKKRKQKVPAVLLIHGGGWRSGDRSQQIPMAQQLAAKGYVAVTAAYRLSTEAKYPAAVYDLKAAVRWMKANAGTYGIDTSKITVLGCSAGGQLAALLGTTQNDPDFEDDRCHPGFSTTVAAIIDVDGTLAFIHPESGDGSDKPGKPSAATLWLGATAAEAPGLWQKVAPLNHVNQNTPPVLFLNSSVTRMHAGRNDMIHQLDSMHIYSRVHTFDDAPHPFWLFDPWFSPMMEEIYAFLKQVF